MQEIDEQEEEMINEYIDIDVDLDKKNKSKETSLKLDQIDI